MAHILAATAIGAAAAACLLALHKKGELDLTKFLSCFSRNLR